MAATGPCPICGGTDIIPFGTQPGRDFHRCRTCRFTFVRPLPAAAEIEGSYADYSQTPLYARKAAKKLARTARRIRRLKRLVPRGRFIEIGCNLGYAVESARREGFAATGIDVDPMAVAAAAKRFPGCRFLPVSAEALAGTGERFDLLYCSEVIEHVPDPVAFMAAIGGMMAPGAVLYLTTPDGGRARSAGDFLSWRPTRIADHIHFFSRPALRVLAGRSGLRVRRFQLSIKRGIKMIAEAPA